MLIISDLADDLNAKASDDSATNANGKRSLEDDEGIEEAERLKRLKVASEADKPLDEGK